jgi:hypothetical protein
MSREYTDANSDFDNEPLPDGRRTFKVISIRKYMKGETKMYFWELQHKDGQGTQLLLPSMMGELLRVLGCTEVKKNEFDWETELMEGKTFDATVSHGLDKKGVMRQTMTEFAKTKEESDDIPF